ncbi:TetR/AcrR family transcriptional regulator [Pararhodobacter oceanensis]|uniref:TetR/AcrR family transcriptional regulator n=1 Tax=Pararhodobacter oceanensis TaxID=2172121 RepID=A0A2T8HPG0_9RHOB|nr:TetR family transcriptional regulator [Pararhodobacter oceanensis]PVH27293.1 TetR/AcrR family transcriptional regulator [Pararhodobacter oceanensis]
MAVRLSAKDRKAQIVREVFSLADEIGPDRLSTTDVARAVGLTQPAIFRHFSTRGDLWLAVADDIAAQLTAAWSRAEADAQTPEVRLKALIGAQLNAIAGTPSLPSILFSRELQVDNPPLRDVFRLLLGGFQARLVRVIAVQQAKGKLRPAMPAEDIAILLTSLVQGVAIRWALDARSFCLVDEGLRLFDVQMALLDPQKGNHDA